MTDPSVQSDKMAEVARLATTIADRMLEQNAAGTSIPPQQFTMLVSAARMMQDRGEPWPPSVEHVLMEVAKRVEQAEAADQGARTASEGDGAIVHLSQFLSAVKRS